ncbi:MAG TPA: CHRD domain-containing protein [Candidatus Nitrosocosmicus sp.]|nr:CHRD domain-containing protein [Candidatus Nitrosocosmicus sp.]
MNHFRMLPIFVVITFGIAVLSFNGSSIFSYAQQDSDFVANLSGDNIVPTVDTPATGTAKFHVNPNETISFDISVNNIDKVFDVYLGTNDSKNLLELINPYATVLSGPRVTNQFQSAYPTGPVNGELTSGIITPDQFHGSLVGKSISDLASMMKSGQLQVEIRTISHENGEIAGPIMPSK